jgi:hypothetical protein
MNKIQGKQQINESAAAHNSSLAIMNLYVIVMRQMMNVRTAMRPIVLIVSMILLAACQSLLADEENLALAGNLKPGTEAVVLRDQCRLTVLRYGNRRAVVRRLQHL